MYTCDIRNNTYKYQSGLVRHKTVHEAGSKLKCICGSEFTRQDGLKRHQLKCKMLDSKVDDHPVSPEQISDSEPPDNSHIDVHPKKQGKRKQSSSGRIKVAKGRKR